MSEEDWEYLRAGPYVIRLRRERSKRLRRYVWAVQVYRAPAATHRVTFLRDWDTTKTKAIRKAKHAIRERRTTIAESIDALESEHASADEWIRSGERVEALSEAERSSV